MGNVDLKEILELHKLWILGRGGEKADLRHVDFRNADLRHVDFRGADLRDVNLRGADLRDVNLRGVDFRDVNLRGVDFRGVNLRGVDFRGVDLRGVNFRGVDLRGVNLRNVNLRGVDLWGARGDGGRIKSIHCGTYDITYTSEVMQIACEQHTISEWWDFGDDVINEMDRNALGWWKLWRPILREIIKNSPAAKKG